MRNHWRSIRPRQFFTEINKCLPKRIAIGRPRVKYGSRRLEFMRNEGPIPRLKLAETSQYYNTWRHISAMSDNRPYPSQYSTCFKFVQVETKYVGAAFRPKISRGANRNMNQLRSVARSIGYRDWFKCHTWFKCLTRHCSHRQRARFSHVNAPSIGGNSGTALPLLSHGSSHPYVFRISQLVPL